MNLIDELNEIIASYKNDEIRESAEHAKRKSLQSLEKHLENLFGIGYMKKYDPEQVTLKHADHYVREALKEKRYGVMFFGAPGCGKTMSMLHMARRIGEVITLQTCVRRFKDGDIRPLHDSFFANFMTMIYPNNLQRDELQNFLSRRYDYVFLDDLVFVGLTDTKRQQLEAVMESCCRHGSTIFGTSNIKPNDLAVIPEMGRVYSRLSGKCAFEIFKPVDYRQQAHSAIEELQRKAV